LLDGAIVNAAVRLAKMEVVDAADFLQGLWHPRLAERDLKCRVVKNVIFGIFCGINMSFEWLRLHPWHILTNIFTLVFTSGKILPSWKNGSKNNTKLEAEGSRISQIPTNTQTLHPNHMEKAIKHPEYHATRLGRPKAMVSPFPDGVVWIRSRKNMFFHVPACQTPGRTWPDASKLGFWRPNSGVLLIFHFSPFRQLNSKLGKI
jgi:hypothetical protein